MTFHFPVIDGYQIVNDANFSNYQMNWQTNGWFIASLVITLVTIIFVLALGIIHKFHWESNYIIEEDLSKQVIKFRR